MKTAARLVCALSLTAAAAPARAELMADLAPVPELIAMLAPERAACERGWDSAYVFEAPPQAFASPADFNGDGATDFIVDGRLLLCRRGGEELTGFYGLSGAVYPQILLISDEEGEIPWRRFFFEARSSDLIVTRTGEALLLLQQHGGACEATGFVDCWGAYRWLDEAPEAPQGAFISLQGFHFAESPVPPEPQPGAEEARP